MSILDKPSSLTSAFNYVYSPRCLPPSRLLFFFLTLALHNFRLSTFYTRRLAVVQTDKISSIHLFSFQLQPFESQDCGDKLFLIDTNSLFALKMTVGELREVENLGITMKHRFAQFTWPFRVKCIL